MNYLTNYYKNRCEQLQEQIYRLQNLLNENQLDPFSDPSQMTPEMIAAVAERNSNSRRPEEININRTIDTSLQQNPEYVKSEMDQYNRAISLRNELESENARASRDRLNKEQEEAKQKEKDRLEQLKIKQENVENEEMKNYPGYNPPADPKEKQMYDKIFFQQMRLQQMRDLFGIDTIA